MADAVGSGELDVFCVGEPWGSVVVSAGVGELILPGGAIWAKAPEKVLAARRPWIEANDKAVGGLMRAVWRAARWPDQPENRVLAIDILARSAHLNLPVPAVEHALTGRFATRLGGPPVYVPDFVLFHDRATNFPWPSQAAWIGAQIAQITGIERTHAIAVAQNSVRPDFYRAHLGQMGVDMPGASSKIEGALSNATAIASTKGQMILGPELSLTAKHVTLARIFD